MTAVLVLGEPAADLTVRPADRGSGGSQIELQAGGTVGNTALVLAKLGVPAALVGAVGQDAFGAEVRRGFQEVGIDGTHLRRLPDATLLVVNVILPDGERTMTAYPPERSAATRLAPEDLPLDALRTARWLHVSGTILAETPSRDAALAALHLAQEAGVPTSLDFNLRLGGDAFEQHTAPQLPRDTRHAHTVAAGLARVVFGSDLEFRAVLGEDAAAWLRRAPPGMVAVVRAGARGCAGFEATTQGVTGTQVPSFPAHVVDTRGAGDAFDAGFIAARLAGHDVPTALRWGQATGALSVSGRGAHEAVTLAAFHRLLDPGDPHGLHHPAQD